MSNLFKIFSLLLIFLSLLGRQGFCEDQKRKIISVDKAEICVRDSETEDYICKGNTFPSSAGKLYCITKSSDMRENAVLIHYWIFKNRIVATYPFTSTSSRAKFMSPKTVTSDQSGNWTVEIRDEEGTLLKSIAFTLTP